jgi:hypothetical protein
MAIHTFFIKNFVLEKCSYGGISAQVINNCVDFLTELYLNNLPFPDWYIPSTRGEIFMSWDKYLMRVDINETHLEVLLLSHLIPAAPCIYPLGTIPDPVLSRLKEL